MFLPPYLFDFHHPPHPLLWRGVWFTLRLDVWNKVVALCSVVRLCGGWSSVEMHLPVTNLMKVLWLCRGATVSVGLGGLRTRRTRCLCQNIWNSFYSVLWLECFRFFPVIAGMMSSFTNHTDTILLFPIPAPITKIGTCRVLLCLRLCSLHSHCWLLLHLMFNCIHPSVILNSLQRQGSFIRNQGMKAECIADEPVPWLSEMFCMIQCLLLEMSSSRRLDRVDVSPTGQFLVWRCAHTLTPPPTQT